MLALEEIVLFGVFSKIVNAQQPQSDFDDWMLTPGAKAPSSFQINVSPPTTGVRVITDAGKLLSSIVALILIVSALAAFIYLVMGGIRWITSGGDKAGVDAARNQIQAALLGLFIVFAAWAFMVVLEQFFGVSVLSGIKIPTPF